jgi:hypothetical protein
MKLDRRSTFRATLVIALMFVITISSLRADTGTCGGTTTTLPFTDVMGNLFFCSIAEAYFSALTNGTTPTTYSPAQNVPRDQMSALITRTLDQSLRRGSSRAALKHFWTPTSADGLGLTTVGTNPASVVSDGADLWVANNDATVSRVRASDGKLLETWAGATNAFGVLAAKGLIFVTGYADPGKLYQIDPTQPAGLVTILPVTLGANPSNLAFDGSRIWTANDSGSVSIVTLNPPSVTTVTGFSSLRGILYDGTNIWVTSYVAAKLYRLDSNGAIIQTLGMGDFPVNPVFDGTNIWVPNALGSGLTVVRASTGTIVAGFVGNGLQNPSTAAFDGERILVTNSGGDSVSLWKAADLTPLGSVSTGPGTTPAGACSDGHNFWITLSLSHKLARF